MNILKSIKHLIEKAGIEFSDSKEDLCCYGFDASKLESSPSIIVWPKSTADVLTIVKLSYDKNIPIIPRGAGTSTTAAAVPKQGAIVISFERMDRILEIDTGNLTVIVEPGVINGILQKELSLKGLFYPPDPASMNFCTIGGNVATNAGGPRTLKYGVTGNYVLELEAVTADGRVIKTGVKTVKGVVGYNLKSLLVGSEGTLAIITKIRLRIIPEPECILTLVVTFNKLDSCAKACSKIISSGIIPRCMELMDKGAIDAVEKYSSIGLCDAEAMLLIELDGNYHAVKEEADRLAEICKNEKGDIKVAEDTISRERLWKARRAIAPALHYIASTKINQDIVVPITEIPNMLKFLESLSEKNSIKIISFGHAGDGNLHVNIMVNNDQEYKKGHSLVKEIFKETLRLGGTISGEHGIGLTKAKYITMEIGPYELGLMKGIKKLFDHKNILNPGKIFP